MNQHRDVPGPNKLNYRLGGTAPAKKEAEALSSQIDLERKTAEHQRGEKSRNLVALGTRGLVGTIMTVAIVAVLVVAWHHLTPKEVHWLSEGQLSDIKTFLFSGAIVGAVSTYIQRNS